MPSAPAAGRPWGLLRDAGEPRTGCRSPTTVGPRPALSVPFKKTCPSRCLHQRLLLSSPLKAEARLPAQPSVRSRSPHRPAPNKGARRRPLLPRIAVALFFCSVAPSAKWGMKGPSVLSAPPPLRAPPPRAAAAGSPARSGALSPVTMRRGAHVQTRARLFGTDRFSERHRPANQEHIAHTPVRSA